LTNLQADGWRGENPASSWLLASLLALIGFQLRLVIVAVPPVLPELRSDLNLSFSATGALTAIPVLGLGAAAVPGAILTNRFGARKVVAVAMVGLGLSGVLRVTPPLPYSLYFWTALLSISVAVAQPALTMSVRGWFPDHIQQASTIYSMSLGVGALCGATLSVFLLTFGGWRGTFVIWSSLALAAAAGWLLLSPGRRALHEPLPHGLGPLVRDRSVWHVAALFGGQSLVFYAAITWIPFVLQAYGPNYRAFVLFLFQVVGLPLTGILAAIRWPWARSRLWYMTSGLLMTVGSAGFLLGLTQLAWLWVTLLGLGASVVFAGTLALPAMLATTKAAVPGYAALTLTAGYSLSFLGPLLGGILLDQTHIQTSPFWVIVTASAMTAVLGASLPRPKAANRTNRDIALLSSD
jgi:MFS transporter, CP family, cyanate transporter